VKRHQIDGDHFDTLTRGLANPASRRTALGVGLSGILGALGVTETAAKKHKKWCKKKCGPCQRCKKGKCKPTAAGTLCTLADGEEGTCQSGACVFTCAPGLTDCGGYCADLQTDDNNCGACGNYCILFDPVCQGGSCCAPTAFSCSDDEDCCSGNCANGKCHG
jgi:hypothetical protein